jgi:uncharacterized protein YdeI (YjbR/CyaY-like superfamily)
VSKQTAQKKSAHATQYAEIEPKSREAWRAWLKANHRQPDSVWLVLTKGANDLNAAAATEEALCFGWIDSLPRKVDATRWKLLMSPRKAKSPWSAVNKKLVEKLIASRRMTAAGFAKIEAAKADGSWEIYDVAESLQEPDSLITAFAAAPQARRTWDTFAPSSRKGILWWIASAKTEPTRAKRVAETVRLALLGLRANYPESRGK